MAQKEDSTHYLIARLEARRSATLVQWAALAGAVLCIVLAARLQTPINQQRKDLQLVMHSDIYKELPPKYAWVTAAGGTFRGIAADILWMRADQLKEEGKYYESHQLAKWICTLQPRFAAVWSFQAWNMSYNISVATHTAQERWQWVYNGIRLLRDEGIPNNPRVIPLYHQLAWTWFHKIGDRMDDFHWAFKRDWAATMQTLLGPPPAGVGNAEAINWFRPVAEAPRTLDNLIARRPGVAHLVKALDDLGVDVAAATSNKRVLHPLEETLFHSFTAFNLEKELAPLRVSEQAPKSTREPSDQQAKLNEFFRGAPKEDLDALLAYLRAKVLREQYKMDPRYMLDLTGQLGTSQPIPIDWRTPWSEAIYWAKYGVEKGSELANPKAFDLLNTDRILLFSLSTIAREGRYTFRLKLDDPANSFLSLAPDLRYIEAMHKKYLELGKRHAEKDEVVGETAGESLRSGHVNNLHSAVVSLYLAGKKDEAQKYFDYLAINYKDQFTRQTKPMYLKSLDDFVMGELKEMIGSYGEAVYAITSLLTAGYVNLASGWADEYAAAVQNATLLYKEYQKDHQDDRQGRLTLPEFADMRAQTLAVFVTDPQYPLLYRSLVWDREQVEVKRRYYDLIAGPFHQQCETLKLDAAKVFPEPPGMAEWRKDHPTPANPEQVSEEYKKRKQAAKENR